MLIPCLFFSNLSRVILALSTSYISCTTIIRENFWNRLATRHESSGLAYLSLGEIQGENENITMLNTACATHSDLLLEILELASFR